MRGRAGADAGGTSLLAEHQHDYGSLYGTLNHGRLDTNALRDLLVSLSHGETSTVSTIRPSNRGSGTAVRRCSPDRLFCLVHGRNGRSSDHVVPGWPYSFVAALTPDRTSWTQVLDAVRLGPTDDAAAVTADQLRAVVERLTVAGQWQDSDRNILVVMDAGYDVMRLAWLLSDLPVELVGRLRSDRVLRLPKPPRIYDPRGGRPPKHGPEFRLAKPETWPESTVLTVNDTPRYDKAEARAWDRVHPGSPTARPGSTWTANST
ncbi:transposase [Streptomyces sp. NPDC056728]